jgi:hypothetical protein
LGLLALEKVRARQRSRISNIKHGDANTKLFYLWTNGRKRKKHIHLLHTAQGLAFSHEDKEKEILRYFKELLGTKHSREITLNWDELAYPHFNLDNLENEILSDEVKRAIADMPKENAPGPDRFIGAFYARCWDIVKSDVIQAVQQLSQLRGNTFNLFNTANIVLISKKDRAECIRDYMPIRLVHSVAKKIQRSLQAD